MAESKELADDMNKGIGERITMKSITIDLKTANTVNEIFQWIAANPKRYKAFLLDMDASEPEMEQLMFDWDFMLTDAEEENE